MGPLNTFTEAQLAYFTEIDYVDHFAWIALAAGEPGEPALGVARYVRLPEDRQAADAAVVVVDTHQGRGIGTLLLQALGAVALENGICRFRGYVLAENRPMIELLKHLGAEVTFDSSGTMRFELDLPEQMAELKETGLYQVLRTVACGEAPGLVTPQTIVGSKDVR
jgi:GNAT superfamily N-acetyltransferase